MTRTLALCLPLALALGLVVICVGLLARSTGVQLAGVALSAFFLIRWHHEIGS